MTLKTFLDYCKNSGVWIAFALIGSIGFNQYSELKSMERNIETAIAKGIDPLAIRCAYNSDSTMCVAYAVSHWQSVPYTVKK